MKTIDNANLFKAVIDLKSECREFSEFIDRCAKDKRPEAEKFAETKMIVEMIEKIQAVARKAKSEVKANSDDDKCTYCDICGSTVPIADTYGIEDEGGYVDLHCPICLDLYKKENPEFVEDEVVECRNCNEMVLKSKTEEHNGKDICNTCLDKHSSSFMGWLAGKVDEQIEKAKEEQS